MTDQTQRINAAVNDALAGHEDIGYAVGHFFGTVPIPDGTAAESPQMRDVRVQQFVELLRSAIGAGSASRAGRPE